MSRLTEAERTATLARYDDWMEYVAARARKLGVRLWPALVSELHDAAPHAPGWLRAEFAEQLAQRYVVSG